MHLHSPGAASRHHNSDEPDWQQALPTEWRAEAVAPLRFTIHREYEMPASRTLGYDQAGQTCYYHHAFALGEPRSDDDEEFYETIVHGEEVHAWRLRDQRWLVWSVIRKEGDCRGNRSCYSFSESMPR
ncbi:MAG: hypothetical protein ABI606_10710 [Rhodoferax sp.]